jgi:lipoate-protein ligase A
VNACDLSLSSPAENLAADEALLDFCEAGRAGEVLRFWQPTEYFVVAGYANKLASEVNLAFCREHRIPIYRRCTGGGTVLQGPGVLNYSLVLRITETTTGLGIPATNDFVLTRHQRALAGLLQKPVQRAGHTDLAIDGLKFSGNSQRRRKNCLLFHGSFLLEFDLGLVEKSLPFPSHQPPYRAGRSHADFLMNLRVDPSRVKSELARVWNAVDLVNDPPLAEIAALADQKYCSDAWNKKF